MNNYNEKRIFRVVFYLEPFKKFGPLCRYFININSEKIQEQLFTGYFDMIYNGKRLYDIKELYPVEFFVDLDQFEKYSYNIYTEAEGIILKGTIVFDNVYECDWITATQNAFYDSVYNKVKKGVPFYTLEKMHEKFAKPAISSRELCFKPYKEPFF